MTRHIVRFLLMPLLATGLLACGESATSDTGDPSGDAKPPGDSDDAINTTDDPVIDPGDGGNYTVELTADDFVENIDNPYLPLSRGSKWTYTETTADGDLEDIVVEVLPTVKIVNGVQATVVRDTVSIDGELVEDTYDWFAQDTDGNVWYLGEDVTDFENGKPVSTAGSFEWGVDGALPGIVMPADPTVGRAYRQEFYEGEAEDMGEIVAAGETVEINGTTYTDVVVTHDWNPLEPDVIEEKSYAPGIGNVASRKIAGDEGEALLVSFEPA